MGANIKETEDGMIIKKSTLNGANLNTYNDHRIALSLIVAASCAKGKSKINEINCINKSYPNFLKLLYGEI